MSMFVYIPHRNVCMHFSWSLSSSISWTEDFKALEKGRDTRWKPGSLKDHMEWSGQKEINTIGLSHRDFGVCLCST